MTQKTPSWKDEAFEVVFGLIGIGVLLVLIPLAVIVFNRISDHVKSQTAATYKDCVSRGGKITESAWGVSCVGVTAPGTR